MLQIDGPLEGPSLTQREKQVLELVARGLSAKEVAYEINIAPRTVERHIENVRNKMRARNKTHMIVKAMTCGELRFVEDKFMTDRGAQDIHHEVAECELILQV